MEEYEEEEKETVPCVETFVDEIDGLFLMREEAELSYEKALISCEISILIKEHMKVDYRTSAICACNHDIWKKERHFILEGFYDHELIDF